MMKTVLLLLLLFIFAGISQAKKCSFLTPKFTIRIKNEIPKSQVSVHCRSKEDDLGFHNLKEQEEYYWKFCQNLWGTTLFGCDVKWGNNKASFHGFDLKLSQNYCGKFVCRWSVKEDGIYFTNKKKKFFKFYNWTTNPHEVHFNRKFSLGKLEV